MRPRDRVDDREPEAGSASRPRDVRAAEAIERVREEVGGKARPLVAHPQHDHPRDVHRLEPDRAGAVTERVVDEVPERLLEAQPVADEDAILRCVDLERAARFGGSGVEPPGHGIEHLADDVALTRERKPPVLGAREHQQVLGESHEPLDLLPRRPERRLQLLARAWPARSELELGLEQRERRAQLVARVGDEAALARDALLEPSDHLVQRLARGGGSRRAQAAVAAAGPTRRSRSPRRACASPPRGGARRPRGSSRRARSG